MNIDVFNGDADGICALHQLRLADPAEATLITGVKRDIALLQRVEAGSGDLVTVLDISLDKNRDNLVKLLDAGARVDYFDHHFAGEIPANALLSHHIDTAADVCTSLIVDKNLRESGKPQHTAWAVTAAFGDNLFEAARSAAKPLGITGERLEQLERLGTLLNYNGYGSDLSDLYFAPDVLYQAVAAFKDPFDFIDSSNEFTRLDQGYSADMQRAAEVAPVVANDSIAVFVFPDDPYARRVSGVYSNLLARENPSRAHALASTLPGGDFLISVRAPKQNATGADELCRQFATGGGRKAAAGINKLPSAELDAFTEAMQRQFG